MKLEAGNSNEPLSRLFRVQGKFSCYFSRAAILGANAAEFLQYLSSQHYKDTCSFSLEDSEKTFVALVCLPPLKPRTCRKHFLLPHICPSAKRASAAEWFQWQLNSACTARLCQPLPPWRSPSPAQCRCLLQRQEKERGKKSHRDERCFISRYDNPGRQSLTAYRTKPDVRHGLYLLL